MKSFVLFIVALIVSMTASSDASVPSSGNDEKYVIVRPEAGERAWLGVSVQDLSAEKAKELGMKKAEGAYVSEVMKKSPAEAAGVKEGDVIVEFNGRQIYDADGLVSAVKKAEVGQKATVTVIRKGEKKDFAVQLKKHPSRRFNFAVTPPSIPHRVEFFRATRMGLRLIPLNPQLGKFFEVPEGKGLMVESVEEGSAAEKAGFQAGDIVVKVGDRSVARLQDFRKALKEYDEGEKVAVEVLRKGVRKTLMVEVEEDWDEEFDFFIGEHRMPEFDVEFPDIEPLREFDFNLDTIRPELERLQRELDRLKERIGEGIKQRMRLDKERIHET